MCLGESHFKFTASAYKMAMPLPYAGGCKPKILHHAGKVGKGLQILCSFKFHLHASRSILFPTRASVTSCLDRASCNQRMHKPVDHPLNDVAKWKEKSCILHLLKHLLHPSLHAVEGFLQLLQLQPNQMEMD